MTYRDPEQVWPLIESLRERGAFGLEPLRGAYEHRVEVCREMSWAVPNKKAIEAAAQFFGPDSVVSPGCGHALWEALISYVSTGG